MTSTHVENEARNPITDGIDVWTMWCGAQCLAFPDGSLVPEIDFYLEADADRAACEPCREAARRARAEASIAILGSRETERAA